MRSLGQTFHPIEPLFFHRDNNFFSFPFDNMEEHQHVFLGNDFVD
ncbi:MAG: hypothetical protein RJB36_1489 [Bacteroidota bacterium]